MDRDLMSFRSQCRALPCDERFRRRALTGAPRSLTMSLMRAKLPIELPVSATNRMVWTRLPARGSAPDQARCARCAQRDAPEVVPKPCAKVRNLPGSLTAGDTVEVER
jgi:hypothetical protein